MREIEPGGYEYRGYFVRVDYTRIANPYDVYIYRTRRRYKSRGVPETVFRESTKPHALQHARERIDEWVN